MVVESAAVDMQVVDDKLLIDAVLDEKPPAEAEAMRAIELKAKESYEMGKAAIGRSAEKAVLAAAGGPWPESRKHEYAIVVCHVSS